MKATFNSAVIAESDDTVVLEENHYFPPDSVKTEHLEKSTTTYECPWKGHAVYYRVRAGGRTAEDAAWSYPDQSRAREKSRSTSPSEDAFS